MSDVPKEVCPACGEKGGSPDYLVVRYRIRGRNGAVIDCYVCGERTIYPEKGDQYTAWYRLPRITRRTSKHLEREIGPMDEGLDAELESRLSGEGDSE